jgi:hypothetical protein
MKLGQVCKHLWHSEWPARTAGLLFLVAVCAGAYWLGVDHRRSGITPDGLYIDPKYLDFGEVWEQERFEWTLPIENRAKVDAEISHFLASYQCLDLRPARLVVPAGESRNLMLKLDLTWNMEVGAKGGPRPEGSGILRREESGDGLRSRFELNLAPVASDKRSVYSNWRVSGRVRKAISIAPRALHFRHPQMRGQAFEPLFLRVRAHADFKNVLTEYDRNELTVNHMPDSVPNEWLFRVAPNPRRKVFVYRPPLSSASGLGEQSRACMSARGSRSC